jgi:hypothetical protein
MPRVQEGAVPPVGYREFRPGDTRGRHIKRIVRSIFSAFFIPMVARAPSRVAPVRRTVRAGILATSSISGNDDGRRTKSRCPVG